MDWKAQANDRFSKGRDAQKWSAIYSPELTNVDAANFRKRRDFTYDYLRQHLTGSERILDLGCGAAPLLQRLAEHDYELIGIDYSQDMLDLARTNLGTKAVPLMRGECEYIPLSDASVDAIACLGVISYAESIESALREIQRVLKPGGRAIVTYRNYYNQFFLDPVYALIRGIKKLLGKGRVEKQIGRSIPRSEVLESLHKTQLQLIDEHQIGFGAIRLNGKVIADGRAAIKLDGIITRCLRFLRLNRLFRTASDIHILVLTK